MNSDGVTTWCFVQALPELDEAGAIIGYVTDITERKRAEETLLESEHALQERVADLEEAHRKLEMQAESLNRLAEELLLARDEARAADRVKSEFLATMSHELRTPMASVLGALGLVEGGAAGRLAEKAQSLIEITFRNCKRLVRLLNDVLDIEKMESGSSNFETSLLKLGPLARDAIETIAQYSAEHHVEVRLVEDVDFVEVLGDGDRLIKVLTNLLSNAIKFSPRGGVVEVRISRSDHSVRLSVKDCGPGIPEGFRDQVFERFTQADRADSRRGGTGLGLSISEMIIDRHDGKIAFDTEVGKGTTFYFDLPDCADGGDDAIEVRTAVAG